jgi:hypothetical protein
VATLLTEQLISNKKLINNKIKPFNCKYVIIPEVLRSVWPWSDFSSGYRLPMAGAYEPTVSV